MVRQHLLLSAILKKNLHLERIPLVILLLLLLSPLVIQYFSEQKRLQVWNPESNTSTRTGSIFTLNRMTLFSESSMLFLISYNVNAALEARLSFQSFPCSFQYLTMYINAALEAISNFSKNKRASTGDVDADNIHCAAKRSKYSCARQGNQPKAPSYSFS